MPEVAQQTLILTYRYRLLPTCAQHGRLRAALDHSRDLYNAALEERISAYGKAKRFISLNDQQAGLTELRQDASFASYPVSLQRWPLKRLDTAFKGFFARLKARSGKAGFPRFKPRERFKTFGFTDRWGWKVESRRLHIKGIGSIRLSEHRSIPGPPLALKVKRDGVHWYALFSVAAPCAPTPIDTAVGVDFGVTHLATLSTGEHIANARHEARLAARVRRTQRALSRCQRASRNRIKAKARLAAIKRMETSARSTHLHQVSAGLTRRFSTLVLESLQISNMVRSASGTTEKPGCGVAQKAGLNRLVHDAAFGQLKQFIRYKAERAGGRVIEVDARRSSQTCSACGATDPMSRRSQARFVCTSCGHEANADVNAARVIALRGGVAVPGALNPEITRDGRGKLGALVASEMLPSTLTG